MTYFDKKRATHLEDFQEASKPYEAYKTTYLTIAHSNIQRLIPNLRPKLGIVAYTIDLTTRNYTDTLIPKLTSIFRNHLFKIYDSFKDINKRLEKMEEINVSTHRFALGFNINNYKDKYTITIYAKDLHQHLSKLKRLSSSEKMKELPLTKIRHLEELKEIETDRHKLRLEITIRGWKEIHTRAYYNYLDKIKRLIQLVDLKLSNLDTTGKTRAENIQEIDDDANKEIETIEKEMEEELGHSNGFSLPKTDRKPDRNIKLTKSIDFG